MTWKVLAFSCERWTKENAERSDESLVRRSQELLGRFRREEPALDGCPLKEALQSGPSGQDEAPQV